MFELNQFHKIEKENKKDDKSNTHFISLKHVVVLVILNYC